MASIGLVPLNVFDFLDVDGVCCFVCALSPLFCFILHLCCKLDFQRYFGALVALLL